MATNQTSIQLPVAAIALTSLQLAEVLHLTGMTKVADAIVTQLVVIQFQEVWMLTGPLTMRHASGTAQNKNALTLTSQTGASQNVSVSATQVVQLIAQPINQISIP